MKKSFKEKIVGYFLKIAKKNRFLKIPAICLMTVVLFLYYCAMNLEGNCKRYASICFVLVFFMLSSSFAFPILADQGGFVSTEGINTTIYADAVNGNAQVAVEPSGAVLAERHDLSDNISLPDDDEILLEYEESQHASADDDRFTLEDIIKGFDTNETNTTELEIQSNVFENKDWRLILINKQHPIPDDYNFDLVTIKGSMQCDARIVDELLAMMQAAKKEGIDLVIRSPYRDKDRQVYLFDRKINMYMKNGLSYMEAYKTASQVVTVPGASEHQVGLAIDITSESYASLDEGFGETEAGKWLKANSHEYGFILRYPLGKEYITSIEYEPWHFRYVGKDAAKIITKGNLSLEEFWDKYL